MLTVPEGYREAMAAGVVKPWLITLLYLLMTTGANDRCSQVNETLLEGYHQAMEVFPEMFRQISANLTYNGGFDEKFDKNFG